MKWKSALVTALSGKIGGLIASHSKGINYFKAWASPTNPSTARQQAVRNNFAALADAWNSTLTAAQRTAWNLYGATVDFLDNQGDVINLSGYSQYQRSNGAALIAGLPRVDAAPTNFTLAATDPAFVPTVDETNQQISVVFDDTLAWVDEDDAAMLIYMSSPQNPGVEYIGSPIRYAGCFLGDSGTPLTSPQVLAVPFAVATGQKVKVLGRIIRADGRLSYQFQASVAVVA